MATTACAADSEAALAELGLEDLMKIEITSVSRRPQRLSDTAAAISVLTADDIRRSGAASIPDALRLVPGVDVARINGTYQAVSVRGFDNGFAMKLLVLVDGRSVYSPLFSGTFWDAQDTMIEDIERIEVIRGPGAAIWGSNAVNGVINIITKRTADTQRGLATATYGPYERRAGVRDGSTSTDGTAWRLFANATERDGTVLPTGQTGGAVRQERVGLRADRAIGSRDQISVHGEAYHGSSGAPATALPIDAPLAVANFSTDSQPRGGHLMTRWEHGLAGGSTVITEAYFDRNVTCTPDAFPPTYLGCNATFDNGGTAHAKGFEVSAEWRPSPQWRVQANYSYAHVEVRHPGSAGPLSNSSLSGGASPRHQGSLHVSGDLTDRIQTDLTVRHVDTLTTFVTPAYTAVDARIGWRPVPKLELSLIGRNLTDGRHIEFGMDPFFTPADVRRSVMLKAILEF